MAKKKKEKLSKQFSMTCATGALALIGVTSYLAGVDLTAMDLSMESSDLIEQLGNTSLHRQLKILYLGIPSAIVLSILGYIMGDILDNPRGRVPEKELGLDKDSGGGSGKGSAAAKPKEPDHLITGDEMFLDDLDFGDDMFEPAGG